MFSSSKSTFPNTGPPPQELRLVLVGKTGSGKSASGNTIMGQECFEANPSMGSVTQTCQMVRGTVLGRRVTLVDTPGLFDTEMSEEVVGQELLRCLTMLAPGPHAILLVLQVGRYTPEEQKCVEEIQQLFAGNVAPYTILLFTHADKLKGESIRSFIGNQNQKVKDLVKHFGDRFLAFNNENSNNHSQVACLLKMIDDMLVQNGNRHFTNESLQKTEQALVVFQKEYLTGVQEKITNDKKKAREELDEKLKRFRQRMSLEQQEEQKKRSQAVQRIRMLEQTKKQLELELDEEKKKVKRLDVREKNRLKEEEAYRKEIEGQIIQKENKLMQKHLDYAREKAMFSPEFLRNLTLGVVGLGLLATGAGAGFGVAALMGGGTAAATGAAAGTATVISVEAISAAAVAVASKLGPLVMTQCSIQ